MKKTTRKDELAIVEGIKRGREDMRAGRVVPHKVAMRRLRATIALAARKGRSGKHG